MHPHSPALNTVAFDYYACTYVNGSDQYGWGDHGLHNFARLQVETTGGSNSSTYDVLGIFTVDPLSVVKVLDRITEGSSLEDEWVEVPFPVAYIIFGEMPSN